MTYPRRDDSGVATVFAAITMMAIVSVTALILQVGAASLARNRAEAAADAAALAASLLALEGSAVACRRAAEVAAENGARIGQCAMVGADVLVTVSVGVRLGPLSARAVGRARGGPVADQSP